jgi:DNA-directed RNA polymerase specialized sigma24 family protein
MNSLSNNRVADNEKSQYATSTYFCHVFIESMADLHRLSFFLTADHDKAEQCFVAGLGDCLKANHVFKEWAHSWAKHTIIQQAIRILQPHPDHASSFPAGQSQNSQAALLGDFEVYRVLALEDFERFVFVMSVLEHYSEHDCARLLGCSVQDIQRARVRAPEQLVRSHRTPSAHDSLMDFQEMDR